jgi:hypothetical protein
MSSHYDQSKRSKRRVFPQFRLKFKTSFYRPGQTVGFPGGWGSHISRQLARESGKVVSPKHRPCLPLRQKILLILISVRDWVDPRTTVRPEGLCQWKIPMTSSGIEPATFRVVAQCFNQLRHRKFILLTQILYSLQHTQPTQETDRYSCPLLDSNPQSQQADGHRPTP